MKRENKQTTPSPALIDAIGRCYARAVAEDLLAEYDRAVEAAAAKKPKRSSTSTRART